MKKLLGIITAIVLMTTIVSAGSKCCPSKKSSCGTKKTWKELTPAEKAEKYENYAKKYDTKAEKAEKDGKTKAAAAYKKCASAKRKMSKAFGSEDKAMMKEGHQEFKEAKNELIELGEIKAEPLDSKTHKAKKCK